MLLERIAPEGLTEQSNPTKGIASEKSTQEILSARDPVSRGNTIIPDPISTQPPPAAASPAEASRDAAEIKKLQCDLQKPTCPKCGLTVPDPGAPPLSSGLSDRKSRSSSRSSSRSRSNVAGSHQATPADSCLQLLMACLWCQGSMLLLGLLEACTSCLHTLCPSCCQVCTRCCLAVQEVPVEELNCHAHCHSMLVQSCCESTECLEFCLECCEILHRS